MQAPVILVAPEVAKKMILIIKLSARRFFLHRLQTHSERMFASRECCPNTQSFIKSCSKIFEVSGFIGCPLVHGLALKMTPSSLYWPSHFITKSKLQKYLTIFVNLIRDNEIQVHLQP